MDTNDAARLDRRRFLAATIGTGAALAATSTLAPLTRSAGAQGFAANLVHGSRPEVTHGVQSGDVGRHDAVVWARADRPGRMIVEVSPTESFRRAAALRRPAVGASPATSWASCWSEGCRPAPTSTTACGSRRSTARRAGAPVVGRLRTAPRGRGAHFVWSGDTCGQGWGINPDDGGLRTYEAMRALGPDFFVHSGDVIYADGPLARVGGAARRLGVAEHRDAREVQGRRDPGRVPRQPPLQPARRQRAALQRRGADHRPVGRPRGDQQLVPRRDPRAAAVPGEERRRPDRPGPPGVLRVPPHPPAGRRRGPGVPPELAYGRSLDLFVLDMRSHRGPNSAGTQAAPGARHRRSWARPSSAGSAGSSPARGRRGR